MTEKRKAKRIREGWAVKLDLTAKSGRIGTVTLPMIEYSQDECIVGAMRQAEKQFPQWSSKVVEIEPISVKEHDLERI